MQGCRMFLMPLCATMGCQYRAPNSASPIIISMQQRSDEEGLQGLNWNEHIQKRPEMYIGQIGDGNKAQDGIYALLRDAIDMSVDEFQRGFCKGISIDANRVSITVREFGRGIPLKDVVHATSGVSVGIGAQSTNLTVHPIKVVNALSNVFNLTSYRDGKCSWVKYSKGVLLSQGVEKTQECNGLLIGLIRRSGQLLRQIYDHSFLSLQ